MRQSVEKSELWVYKSKATEEHGSKKKKSKEEEDEGGTTSRKAPLLSNSDKQGVYRLILLISFYFSRFNVFN